jgi:predicted SAM-dependent methyltransferase
VLRRLLYPLARQLLSDRTIRLLYYDVLRLWARLRRVTARNVQPAQPRLHLGCGKRHISGWLNIDLSGSDYDIDLASGRLPWRSSVFDTVVSQHLIEHLELERELLPLLGEVYRVMKPGGDLWISTPDMEKIAQIYNAGAIEMLKADRLERFPDYPFSAYNDMPAQQIVNHYFHQLGQHKNLVDFSLLAWALNRAGFTQINRVNEADLLERFPDFPSRADESHSLYVRASKLEGTS